MATSLPAPMATKPTREEQILKLAAASPGIKTSEAAAILGMSSANLGTYTSKLRKAGKLKKTRGTLELAEPSSPPAGADKTPPEPSIGAPVPGSKDGAGDGYKPTYGLNFDESFIESALERMVAVLVGGKMPYIEPDENIFAVSLTSPGSKEEPLDVKIVIDEQGVELTHFFATRAVSNIIFRLGAEVATIGYLSAEDESGNRSISVASMAGSVNGEFDRKFFSQTVDREGKFLEADGEPPKELIAICMDAEMAIKNVGSPILDREFGSNEEAKAALMDIAGLCASKFSDEEIEAPRYFHLLIEDEDGSLHHVELDNPHNDSEEESVSIAVMKGEDPAEKLAEAMRSMSPPRSEEERAWQKEYDHRLLSYHYAPLAVIAHGGRRAALCWVGVNEIGEDVINGLAADGNGLAIGYGKNPSTGRESGGVAAGVQVMAMAQACGWGQ